jgi:hypothetical protein
MDGFPFPGEETSLELPVVYPAQAAEHGDNIEEQYNPPSCVFSAGDPWVRDLGKFGPLVRSVGG